MMPYGCWEFTDVRCVIGLIILIKYLQWSMPIDILTLVFSALLKAKNGRLPSVF